MNPNTNQIERNGTAAPRNPAELLLDLLARNGYQARIVPAGRAGDLRSEYEERRSRREFDELVESDYISALGFEPPPGFPARSIVVAAVPRPQTAAVFNAGGTSRKIIIPPIYTGYRSVTSDWLAWLGEALAPAGYRVAGTDLPLKLLAARSGLSAYGRNNITYVEGLGSYFELVSAWTDIPCEDSEWGPEQMLERCLRCRACVNRCPTSAIRLEPFRLDVSRCIVLHNERDGSIPFPDWIDPDAHNALVGCMECQWICPENKAVKGWVEDTEEFSGEETALLLGGARAEDLSAETTAKLDRLDATRYVDLFPRNLLAVLRSRNRVFSAR